MRVRAAIEARLCEPASDRDERPHVRLPFSLKSDDANIRVALFQRLAASRLFAYGDRSGCLRVAQDRSGRPFRLDVRQRVVVKALVSRHGGKGAARGAALARHTAYLLRAEAGADGQAAEMFDRLADGLDPATGAFGWSKDRHHFRFIISPEHGDRIADLKAYAREVMGRVADDLGQPELRWLGVCHFNTDQPHVHVLVQGRREDGRDLVIPRDYISYGFRARAQEVAQERLGDLSRQAAERRIWRETQADQFTAFDRRLLAAADRDRMVADGVGASDAWAALTRGRLGHLERLGLAERIGGRYRLAENLEPALRRLQQSRDVIRTLNQRHLHGVRSVDQMRQPVVSGHLVEKGFHDRLGATPYVVIRDRQGHEHYARLALGSSAPAIGKTFSLTVDARGVAQIVSPQQAAMGGGLAR